MNQKPILKLIVVAGIVLFFAYNFLYGIYRNNKFYNTKLNHLITSRDNSALRSTVFELSNGVGIDSFSSYNFDLRVGDSIVKDAVSRKFSVYRKMQVSQFTLIHIYTAAD